MDRSRLLRRLCLVVVIGVAAALFFFVRSSNPQPVAQARLAVKCSNSAGARSGSIDGTMREVMVGDSPSGRYFYNPTYGWFDKSHFGTGEPGKVIADVQKMVNAGGGVITIEQEVQGGIAGYSGSYYVSPQVTSTEELGVALAIYRDWSVRFEGWQAELPQTLVGMLSPYAVEDLPSQYLGFFAEANGMAVYEVFACYLPDTGETEDSPPRFTMRRAVVSAADTPVNYPQRLTNQQMTPMIYRPGLGWVHTAWPPAMQMEEIGAESGLWAQVGERNWYFGEAE